MKWATAILLSILLAGCTGAATPPEGRFQDVETRFAGVAAEAFDETTSVTLPAGQHTLKMSVRGDDGFAAFLNAPPQREPYSGMMLPGPQNYISHMGPVRIRELHMLTGAGGGGEWTVQYGCGGPCHYAVAVEEGDTVPEASGLKLSGQVVGTLDSDRQTYEIQVDHDGAARISLDLASKDAMSVHFEDGAGDDVGGWYFPAILAAGWVYETPRDDQASGTWTVTVGCDGHCEFAASVA